jgi:hypothetical protein
MKISKSMSIPSLFPSDDGKVEQLEKIFQQNAFIEEKVNKDPLQTEKRSRRKISQPTSFEFGSEKRYSVPSIYNYRDTTIDDSVSSDGSSSFHQTLPFINPHPGSNHSSTSSINQNNPKLSQASINQMNFQRRYSLKNPVDAKQKNLNMVNNFDMTMESQILPKISQVSINQAPVNFQKRYSLKNQIETKRISTKEEEQSISEFNSMETTVKKNRREGNKLVKVPTLENYSLKDEQFNESPTMISPPRRGMNELDYNLAEYSMEVEKNKNERGVGVTMISPDFSFSFGETFVSESNESVGYTKGVDLSPRDKLSLKNVLN